MAAYACRPLDDEGALDLIPGLGALDERQAGIHRDFADPARQLCRRTELLQGGCDKRARGSAEGILQAVPPVASGVPGGGVVNDLGKGGEEFKGRSDYNQLLALLRSKSGGASSCVFFRRALS